MIQGNQNSMNKAMFALLLHTLQECDSEEILPLSEPEDKEDLILLDDKNSYTFIEI